MSPTIFLVATMLFAGSAGDPVDAAEWRARSDEHFHAGRLMESLEAARQARAMDDGNPWSRFAWIRALAATDAEAARREFPAFLVEPRGLLEAERAILSNALGYLALDLGENAAAHTHFERVPAGSAQQAEAQAGLAIVAARSGNPALALNLLEATRVNGQLPVQWQSFERELRFAVAQREFSDAREWRNANAAGRALATLDELRPTDPVTLRARADLAALRDDPSARERALRDLLAAQPAADGAASELIDTLLVLRRPSEALVVARSQARDRLAGDIALQALERQWTPLIETGLSYRQRRGETGLEQLRNPGAQIAMILTGDRFGRLRVGAETIELRTGAVASGVPYGGSTSLAAALPAHTASGVTGLLHWTPSPGLVFELGHSPDGFAVDNIYGALRWHNDLRGSPLSLGFERMPVTDSQLSFSGVTDPVTGQEFGGVVRNRVYLDGKWGDAQSGFYGRLSSSLLDGQHVEDNSQWEAGLGYWRRAASGEGWVASIGANLSAFGYADNLSRFTLGHGGYFSPRRFVSVGPTIDVQGQGDSTSFRIEGGLAWQQVHEEAVAFFPEDPARQAMSGDPYFDGGERDGLGARVAATFEWRISPTAVAGLRLEGLHGEDYEEIRLQVYARGWKEPVTDPVRRPPQAVLPAVFSESL